MKSLLALLGVALGIGAAMPRAFALDLRVTHLEVSQGTQTASNGVALVAGRATIVRATVESDSAAPVPGIHGRLVVWVNGSEITPMGGALPINETLASTMLFTVPVSPPDRSKENDTMNFELRHPMDIAASADVDFLVTIDTLPGESDTTNNFMRLDDRVFVDRVSPLVYATQITYTPYTGSIPSDDLIKPGVGDALLRGILPVDADPALYRLGSYPPFTFAEGATFAGEFNPFPVLLSDPPAGDNLLTLLASSRQLIVNGGVGASDGVFLYGWIAAPVFSTYGYASIGGRVAFGEFTNITNYQRTFAHEALHNFGFDHNSDRTDEVGWDVGARLDGNPWGNNATGRVKWQLASDPLHPRLSDVMVPESGTNLAWITTTNYNLLLSHPTLSPTLPAALSSELLVVHGIFSRNGNELRRLDPAFSYPWLSEPTSLNPLAKDPPRYRLRLEDVEHKILAEVPFDARVEPGPSDVKRWGFFEVMTPVSPAVRFVRIMDTQTNETFRTGLDRSDVVPTVADVSVAGLAAGGNLPATATVTWTILDTDTPPAGLMAQVVFSPDGIANFVPIGVDLRTNSLTFDATKLPISVGSGVIRIFVSDGLNTSSVQIGGLTTP
jgi:hypothetical protein